MLANLNSQWFRLKELDRAFRLIRRKDNSTDVVWDCHTSSWKCCLEDNAQHCSCWMLNIPEYQIKCCAAAQQVAWLLLGLGRYSSLQALPSFMDSAPAASGARLIGQHHSCGYRQMSGVQEGPTFTRWPAMTLEIIIIREFPQAYGRCLHCCSSKINMLTRGKNLLTPYKKEALLIK
jgi:hypothetical protein